MDIMYDLEYLVDLNSDLIIIHGITMFIVCCLTQAQF